MVGRKATRMGQLYMEDTLKRLCKKMIRRNRPDEGKVKGGEKSEKSLSCPTGDM